MSKWAAKRKKRIIIIVGITLLLIAGFIIANLGKKTPTCVDGIQNGQETGIDCGGSCSRVCEDEVRDLIVWWERPFEVDTGLYNVVAYIDNQNLSSGIEQVNYEFRLYDRENVLVTEPRRGTTFIEPNKRSAIFEPGLTTGDKEAYTVFFKITSRIQWDRSLGDFAYDLFRIEEPVLINQDSAPKLSVNIENTSRFDFTDVPITAVLYNQEGNAVAASRTYIDRMNQGILEQAFFSWPEAFTESISRIEIIPRINPFLYEG